MYGDVSWNIPNEGEEGYIEDRADPSLGVMTVMPIIKVKSPAPSIEAQRDEALCLLCDNKVNNTGDTITDSTDSNTTDSTNDTTNDTSNDTADDIPIIEVKSKEDSLLNEQLWLRTFIRDDGFFTLENEATGAQLTACRLDMPEYKPSELEGLHWVSTFLLTYLLKVAFFQKVRCAF